MKDITTKINEAKNQITGIKTVYFEIGLNDWNYLDIPQSKAGERSPMTPVDIILKKTNKNDIRKIFNKYSLENNYCFDIIRCIDGREYGHDRYWEIGLPGYHTWSTEENKMYTTDFSHKEWHEHEEKADHWATPEAYFKFFGKNYPGVIAVFKIDDYKNAVNKLVK